MSEPFERRLGAIVGGKYRVVRFLAAGGMGAVYEAQHTVVKRRFAVKFLHPDLAVRRDSLARFQREAQAAGALESENVTAAVDFGIAEDGSPFIIMEYLVGESLELLLEREGRLPVGRACDLVLQACRGIQTAHASGIVHRDLKPQNLFVCRREDGTDLLKVLDFGIAKLEALDEEAATRTGTILGTPAYMSPEQARGEKSIDHRTDVYALGAILYELLSGEKPHPGDSHNAVLHHIATQAPVPLASVAPGLSAALVETVMRELSGDPDGRSASADAFGQALSASAVREIWPSATSSLPPPPTPAPSSTLLAPGPAPTPRVLIDAGKQPVRGWRVLVALVLAGTLIAVAIGLVSSGRSPEPSPQVAVPSAAVREAEQPPPVEDLRTPSPPAREAETARGSIAPSALPSGRPGGRPGGRLAEGRAVPEVAAKKSLAAGRASAAPVTFDQRNPYD